MNNDFSEKHVLIIDDNILNQKVAGKIVQTLGHKTTLIGHEGRVDIIQSLEITKPDLILMDVQLIETSGVELTKILKADERFKLIPVIMVTALASESDKKRIMEESNCEDYISKPFMPEVLANKISAFIAVKNINWR